ncbi:MAG: hypothetical protein IJ736_14595, partial [Firmicutes bacterium]|nr:hypothetical protein [Bacillota bacterium]
MLVYSKERYLPTKTGIITIECNDGGFIYAGVKAYNSGVILSQNPGYNNKENLIVVSKPKNISRRKSIDRFYDDLPNPLKPLAYLLYLAESDYTEFSEQVGVLSVILQFIYPTYWFETPKEQRIDMNFGSTIKAEYEYDWKNFFDTSIKYDDIVNPKESKEKFPIYVINAAYSEDLFGNIKPAYTSEPKSDIEFDENGDAVIDIDFDDLPDIDDTEISDIS